MIAKDSIKEFLARPLRDSTKAKSIPESKLDSLLAKSDLDFVTSPRYAQKVCMLLGWKYDSYMFLLGLGAGKSKLTLDLFRNRKRAGQADRMLVLVPNVVNLDAWDDEVSKHAPDLKCCPLDQSGEKARWSALESDADVVVATYNGFCRLVSELTDVKGKSRRKMKMSPKLVDKAASLFGVLVADEITSAKSPTSLWFRVIRRMMRSIRYRYGLTGTPFDKNPEDLWAQFYLIDEGETLGETLTLYRAAFFSATENHFGGTDYEFRKSMKNQLARRLANRSIRFSESECQDLPDAVGGLSGDLLLTPVQMPEMQRPYYLQLSDELKASYGNWSLVDNAYTRMRMICSGWLGARTEDGERAEIVFPQNPAFDAAVDLLNKCEDEQVIVVTWYVTTGSLFMKRLESDGIPAVLINGSVSAKDKKAAMAAFKAEGGPRVLVASTAISKGVNLQAASRRMIFLESPDSTIERRQLEGRIRREGGSGLACYYHDIVVRLGKTPAVHERILESLKTGRDLHEVLIDGAKS